MLLPLESDTDARFARRECEYTEIGREICISSSTSADILEASCRCDVEEFQEEIKVRAENCSDSTRTKTSTDGPDDDSQQGPEHVEARPSRPQLSRRMQ